MGDGAAVEPRSPAIDDKETTAAPETFLIAAADGYRLHGLLFLPKETVNRPARLAIINIATAVPQRFYFSFAGFLAQHGIAVLTYDYRGVGASRPKSLKGFTASLQHWIDDGGSVIQQARKAFPSHEIVNVGHSIGGVVALLNPAAHSVGRIVTVGAQTSFWKDWPLNVRYQRFLLWHIVNPLLTRLLGYYPGQRLGLGEDLPYDYTMDWAASWRKPRGIVEIAPEGEPPSLPCAVTAIGVTDDTIGTRVAIERLHEGVRTARLSYRWIHPADYGLSAIGHFNLFRKKIGYPVWPLLCQMVAD